MRRHRFERWPVGLSEVLAAHQRAPFGWDRSDCSMFAHAVQVMTGYDPIADVRGYHDETSALRRLVEAGFKSTRELVAARFTEIPASEAMRGDLGYPADVPGRLMSPAVMVGAFAYSKCPDGWLILPSSQISVAYAV